MEPGGGRGKGESKIYLGRGAVDFLKVFQDKALTIISPVTDKTSLNKR